MPTEPTGDTDLDAEPATPVSYPVYAAAFAERFRGTGFIQADIDRGWDRYQSTRPAAR